MSNFIEDAYIAISDRIMEVREAGKGKQHLVTDIRHIDLYYGQDLDERGQVNTKLLFNLPAVFIEFNDMPMQTVGRQVQHSGDSLVTIYLISSTKLSTDSTRDATMRSLALEHLERLNQIHYRLQGFNTEVFTSLDRIALQPYGYLGHTIRHTMQYRCRFKDDSAKHNTNAAGTLTLIHSLTILPED